MFFLVFFVVFCIIIIIIIIISIAVNEMILKYFTKSKLPFKVDAYIVFIRPREAMHFMFRILPNTWSFDEYKKCFPLLFDCQMGASLIIVVVILVIVLLFYVLEKQQWSYRDGQLA